MKIANMRQLSGLDVIQNGDFFAICEDPFLYACVLSVGLTVEDAVGCNPEMADVLKFYRPAKEVGE